MVSSRNQNIILIALMFLLLFMVGCSEENENLSQGQISVTNAEGGQVTLNPDKDFYSPGEKVELEAIADDNYQFDKWLINGDKKDEANPTTVSVDRAVVEVQASFTPTNNPDDPDNPDDPTQTYNVDVNVNDDAVGEVALVNADTGQQIDSSTAIEAGTMVKVEANIKADNYQLTHWLVNGNQKSNINPYVIDNIDRDYTITAHFDNKVSLNAESRGIISGVTIKAYDESGTEINALYQDSESVEEQIDAGQKILLTTDTDSSSHGLYAWEINGEKKYEQQLSALGGSQGIEVTADQNLDIKAIYSEIVHEQSYATDQGTIWGAVREGKEKGKIYGPLTEKGLSDVTYLNATGYDISELSDVTPYLVNLRKLNLRKTDIDNDDLKTISELTSLKELNINNTQTTMNVTRLDAFSKLEKLTNLEVLQARYNKIQNVDFIQNLDQLRVLDLLGNDIKNVQPITDLDNLTDVNLLNNQAVLMTGSATEAVPDTSPVPQATLEARTGLTYANSSFNNVAEWKEHLEEIAQGNNIDIHDNISGKVYANSYPEATTSTSGDGEGEIILSPSPSSGKYYYPGSEITVTVSSGANSTYVTNTLEVNGSGISPGDTVTIPNGNVTITAEFKKN